MNNSRNARLAGFAFLFYIAIGIAGMVLSDGATGGQGVPARLANVAAHVASIRVTIIISLLTIACAFVLAVTMYALTRDYDRDLAMLAMVFRIGEGALGIVSVPLTLALISVATTAAAPGSDAAAANLVGGLLLKMDAWTLMVGGWAFAAGSSLYCYIFLRARTIPVALAWLGVAGSVLLVVGLPLQMTRLIGSPITDLLWLPMLVFEVWFGLWLLIKGWPAQTAQTAPR